MAPKDEKQVDKIFAGWLDDLPSLSSKVRMPPFEKNFSMVSSLENKKKNFMSMSAVCTYCSVFILTIADMTWMME